MRKMLFILILLLSVGFTEVLDSHIEGFTNLVDMSDYEIAFIDYNDLDANAPIIYTDGTFWLDYDTNDFTLDSNTLTIVSADVNAGVSTGDMLYWDGRWLPTSDVQWNSSTLTINGPLWVDGVTGNTPTSGAGTRLMWIPSKSAFRAGTAIAGEWDDANVGTYSVGLLQGAKASGSNSFACGYQSYATADDTMALGSVCDATARYAVVIGNGCTADAIGALALGTGAYSGGQRSTSIGFYSQATGINSVAIGPQITATDTNSIALGCGYTNIEPNSLSLGINDIDLLITTGDANFQDTNIRTTGAVYAATVEAAQIDANVVDVTEGITTPDIEITAPSQVYALDHDSFSGFLANEHIDWTDTAEDLNTTGTGFFSEVNIGAAGSSGTKLAVGTVSTTEVYSGISEVVSNSANVITLPSGSLVNAYFSPSTSNSYNMAGTFFNNTTGNYATSGRTYLGLFGGSQTTLAISDTTSARSLKVSGLAFSAFNNADISKSSGVGLGGACNIEVYGQEITTYFGFAGKTISGTKPTVTASGSNITSYISGVYNATNTGNNYGIKVNVTDALDASSTGNINTYGLHITCPVTVTKAGGGLLTSWGICQVSDVINAINGKLRVGDTTAPTRDLEVSGDEMVTGYISQNDIVYSYTGTKTLTDGSATGFVDIVLNANEMIGGEVRYVIYATEGTDYQCHSGSLTFAAVDKAGALTSDIDEVYLAASTTDALSGGTLTDAWTITDGVNKITLDCNANSSLAAPTITIKYTVIVYSSNTVTKL